MVHRAMAALEIGSVYAPIAHDAVPEVVRVGQRGGLVKTMTLSLPTFAFVVGTRAALGAGIGLLLSTRLPVERRRAIGAALVAVGAATTIPAAFSVARGLRRSRRRSLAPGIARDERLIGATRFPRKGDDAIG